MSSDCRAFTNLSQITNLGGGTGTFQYDGLGQRVVKALPSQTTTYVYDAFGQLAAEYYSGTKPSPPCTTCYLTYDYLGSVRMVTDAQANIIARHDFAPFGQEIPGGTAGRGSQWGLTTDVDAKFTGQIRDQESGEDFFNARYFAAALGRFNSPDPMNAGASLGSSQSWNGYGYVLGNPLGLVDPSGTDETPVRVGCPQCTVTVNGGDVDTIGTLGWILSSGQSTYDWGDVFSAVTTAGAPRNPATASTSSSTSLSPAKTGTPPLAACESAILSAVNNRFKAQFTAGEVIKRFQFSKGTPDGGGTLNLNISVPGSMQPTKVAVGRFPVNPATYVLGAGATLHIPQGPGGADSPLTLQFSASQFTAHLDSALPYNPIGLFAHLIQDMSNLGGYKPCP